MLSDVTPAAVNQEASGVMLKVSVFTSTVLPSGVVVPKYGVTLTVAP
jgi:hypothetical protein